MVFPHEFKLQNTNHNQLVDITNLLPNYWSNIWQAFTVKTSQQKFEKSLYVWLKYLIMSDWAQI
jgi:hypothetical protein